MKYQVRQITIENGAITADKCGTATSIKRFLQDVGAETVGEHKVSGWHFDRVYLTAGNMENGAGFAFVK